MATQPDYYALLGVGPGAAAEEIRGAYRRLARQHHPDTSGDPGSAALMRQINEAWEVLRDPLRRGEYDRARPRPPAPRRQTSRGAPARARTTAGKRPAGTPGAAAREADEPAERATGPAVFRGDASIDWYGALGVGPGASRETIRAALGRLAKELEGARISATEFTRRRQVMKEAWGILGDAAMRAAYDRARREMEAPGAGEAHVPEDPASPMPAGYREGPVTVHGAVVDRGTDCSGADLRGADLRGLDLAGIKLAGARLQGADLEGASLRRADLRGVAASGANLRRADLSHADCSDGAFRQADLTGAALAGTVFARGDLTGADLRWAVGPGINLEYADLARADFSGAKVTPALIARGKVSGTVFPDGTLR